MGCLYNLTADPTEHEDLAAKHTDVAQALRARLDKLGKSTFQSDTGGAYEENFAGAASWAEDWWRPWIE